MKWKKPTKRQLEQQIARKRLQTEAHLGMPIAEWRLKKRQEFGAIMRALQLFQFGAAYTPAGNDLYEMAKSADRIKEALEDDWICW